MGQIPQLHAAFIPDERLENSEYATVAIIGGKWNFLGLRDLYRFLVLEDGTVIIGPIGDHAILWQLHVGQEASRARPCLIGAGIIDKRGEISSWKSYRFDKETPEDLRAPIESFIKGLISDESLPLPPHS